MKILLFGISNVGKTTIGELLAERLGFKLYDLDGIIIKRLLQSEGDMVIAITPISYTENFRARIAGEDILAIELYDTPENIFSRLVFSDEHDIIYKYDDYKNEHKEYYLRDIQADLDWYGKIYAEIGIRNRMFIDNDSPTKVVDRIISEYDLTVYT